MAKAPRCLNCHHSKVQHENDEQGCWGFECLEGPEDRRCQEFILAPPKAKVDRNVIRVGHNHPETSHDMRKVELPKSGTKRAQVYGAIVRSGAQGMTDDEIEYALTFSHQSASSTRNSLMEDGLIVDSGRKRLTRFSHEAIVWVMAPR